MFFRGVMSFPLRETSLCPAWLTRIEIPQLQLGGKKQKRGGGRAIHLQVRVNSHFWSPILHSDEKRAHVAVGRVFIGGSPEAGLRFGAFSIIQHTLSPYSKLQMLSVCCFGESCHGGTRKECLSDPDVTDSIGRRRMVFRAEVKKGSWETSHCFLTCLQEHLNITW